MITATFTDTWFGATEMKIETLKTSRRGERVIRFRWAPVNASGCITTGLVTYSTEAAAIQAAKRHVSFSNVAEVG
jgi:hypothetical protein